MRLVWVVPRYGRDVVGGAETLVRALATRATPPGWTVEVATTCARDHGTWANELPAGAEVVDGVTVRRFPVSPRTAHRYDVLHAAVLEGRATYLDEVEWLAQSVWSEDLERWLESTPHDLAILCPYLFGTTIWGTFADADRAAVLPCLHDEPYAHLATVRRMLGRARGCVFNAPAEERLARRLADVRGGGVVGMGFDPPPGPARPGFGEERGLGEYVLYAGRLEEGKRVDVAVDHAVRYARERPGAPRLVLIGSGGYRPPAAAEGVVTRLGYLSEEDKRAAYAGAVALVNPSQLESLSIVLMEAWLEGTPALVAAGSEVMRDHCAASGGGLAFGTYAQYRDALDGLRADPAAARAMGARGREYVLDVYGWTAVARRFAEVAGGLAA
ncbi:glycosyltransferase family 4 protein [Miltoncostaea oceani]|jgi:O-antigen biosynthesis protein|uniref:glycosyltransferase family 4 protein n=1 Tax=Miltoncostaea oceani TaxID=2843216 RepID=UPI001C3DFCBE|nr:glycosyltransferase family 4 protein [Miltoncostaea oceani]